MRNLETILVNSYPSKSIVGRSGAGRSVGEVVVPNAIFGGRCGFSDFDSVEGDSGSRSIARASLSGELSVMESGVRDG